MGVNPSVVASDPSSLLCAAPVGVEYANAAVIGLSRVSVIITIKVAIVVTNKLIM